MAATPELGVEMDRSQELICQSRQENKLPAQLRSCIKAIIQRVTEEYTQYPALALCLCTATPQHMHHHHHPIVHVCMHACTRARTHNFTQRKF